MYIVDDFLKIVKRLGQDNTKKDFMQRTLLNSFFTLSIVVSFFFLLYYAVAQASLVVILPMAAYILIAGFLLYLNAKSKTDKEFIMHASLILILVYALYLSISGAGGSGVAVFWAVLFPVLALMVFSAGRASIFYTVLLFTFLVLFFIISPEADFFETYPLALQIRFLIIYSVVGVFAVLYQRLQSIESNKKEKELLDIKKNIQAKDQLISDLSFKLRSPLSHLVGILNLKQETKDKDLIDEVELSVENLVGLVNSIPSLAGVKGLKIKKRQTLFNLSKSIRKTAELFQTEDYNRLKLHLNISGQLPSKVYADITILKQIIIGAIDFYYTNSDSEFLELELIVGKKSVSDKGCEILFKVQSTKPLAVIEEKKVGNFINNIYDIELPELNYIDQQIKRMNGKLNLYSDDSGTAFLFSIEAGIAEEKKDKPIEYPYEAHTKTPSGNNKKQLNNANILLVEDDKVNQKIMVLTLKKYVKSIEVAQNGKEALDKFGQKKYDLILMDIRMPFMDGYKTTKKIRETETGTSLHIPIIAVTANALEGDKEKCLEAGMNDYMSKPLKTDELIEKMDKLLNASD